MIFSSVKDKNFNFPSRLYSNQFFYSFSKVGTFALDGKIGPDGGNAISKSKVIAMKKSFSEMLERRSLMSGSYQANNKKIKAVNLINYEIIDIYERYIMFNDDKKFYTDTTGTAAHLNSKTAIFHSLKELIEKNSLLLFWYGRKGKVIDYQEVKSLLKVKFTFDSSQQLYLFINDDFFPFLTIISVLVENKKIIGSGISCDIDLERAIKSSIYELILLKEQNRINYYCKNLYNLPNVSVLETDQEQYFHLEYLLNILPEFNLQFFLERKTNVTQDVFELIKLLPSWIQTLYCIYIKHNLNNQLKTVRIYSEELYSHIPIKAFISEKKKIFIVHDLNQRDIEKTPECPII